MAISTLLGYSILHLRGFSQNVVYDRISLEKDQQLIMTRDVENKYDKQATVVKTLDGLIVGRVSKAFTKPYRVMMDTANVLSITTVSRSIDI